MDDLSIIVPTFNEQESIAETIQRLFVACPDAEIIVVDGGSDNTANVVKDLQAGYPTLKYLANLNDRGKGHAIRVGIQASSKLLIAQFDADLQFYPEDLPSLVEVLRAGEADFVLGSRFTATSKRAKGSTPLLRTIGNKSFSLLASIACLHRMTDVLAGVKAWRRIVTESYTLESDSFSYEVELAIKAIRKGWRVVDMPISTEPRRTGVSSVSIISDGARVYYDILKFSFRPKRSL